MIVSSSVRCPTCYRRLPEQTTCSVHPGHSIEPREIIAEDPPAIDGFSDLQLIGFGGFSRVWSAVQQATGRDVALKVSLARDDVRFDREAEAMRHLGSAVCPELIAEGLTAEGHRYLAMERLRGTTLAAWLADCEVQIPPVSEAVALFSKLGAVVQRMHEAGVLHRDLKPENTMILEDRSIRMLDFGLARYLYGETQTQEAPEVHLTQTGAMLGTVAYIAPEQSLGRKNLCERSDIYSLAVMGFELLTGRTPFVGGRSVILQAHTWQKPPAASALAPVSGDVDRILARGMAKDPKDRWETAGVLVETLAGCIDTSAGPAAPRVAARESSRREMALLAIDSVPIAVAQKAAANVGGQIARTYGNGAVLVFASASSLQLGVDAAVAVAHELSPAARSCVVHVATLRARSSERGVIVMGDAIKSSESWSRDFGRGIFATVAAAGFIGASQLVSTSPEGHLVLHPSMRTTPTGESASVDWHSLSTKVQPWGRDELVTEIESAGQRCFDTRVPLLTTIIGDVGAGKTHMAAHLVDRMDRWKSVRIIAIRGTTETDDKGDALLRRLVREAFEIRNESPSSEEIEIKCRSVLGQEAGAEAWPVVARALDIIDRERFAAVSSLVGLTAARQALARAIASALQHGAARRPTLLLVDDAHRADFTTLDALELATLGEDKIALWVVAVAGSQLHELRPNWGARATGSSQHELGPLDDDAARGMLLQLLFPVEFVPESVVTTLVKLAQGIPLYLEEVANSLKQNGAIRAREGTESWFVAADDLLAASQSPLGERLARAALSGMRDDLALFAQLCAVIGEDITAAAVDRVQAQLDAQLGFSSTDPGAGLGHLVDRRLLRGYPGGRYEFGHPMMRDAVEALVPLALRRVLHGATLRSLDSSTTPPARLARHAELCGQNQLAASKYLEVAAVAESRFQYVESQSAYTSALANLGQEEAKKREDALTGRGRVHHFVGRHDDALEDLGAAMEVAIERDDKRAIAEILLERATIFDWKFRYQESARAAQQAALAAAALNDPRLELRCELASARSTFREQRVLDAIEELTRVEAKAKEVDDYSTRVIALAVLGGALAGVDRLDEAEDCLNSMAELSLRMGDRFHLAVAHANRMLVWSARHDYQRAIEDARHAVEVAKEIGAFPIIWVSQHTLAQLLMWLGKFDEALMTALRAREMQHRFSDDPDPQDTLLVGRIKIAKSDEANCAAEELSYLRTHYRNDELLPSHQVQTRMIELWQEQGSGDEWNELLTRSQGILDSDERLELLLVYARAARREGRGADVIKSVTLAHEVADGGSIWLQKFNKLDCIEGM